LKVLIVVESFPRISETFVLNHIKGLLDAKIEVKIFTLNKYVGPAHQLYYDYDLEKITTVKPRLSPNVLTRYMTGISLFRKCYRVCPKAALDSINVFKYKWAALKFIRLYELSLFATAEKFDVVHCHFGPVGEKVAGYQLKGILPAPLIVSFHGYDTDSPHIISNPHFYFNLKRRSDLYIVNSGYTLKKIISLGLDEKKATIIPAALDVNFFYNPAQSQRNNQSIRLITIGRLIPVKGIEFALRAFHRLKEKNGLNKNIEYVIIGEGPEEPVLRRLCEELSLSENVKFLGGRTQTEIRDYLTLSDVFLLTGIKDLNGRQEAQGLVIQEAQAMGLPVIVSDIGGVSEGFVDGKTGFLVEEKNISQIADCLLKLVSDGYLRAEMGLQGRKFVENKYSIEVTTEKIVNEYKLLLAVQP